MSRVYKKLLYPVGRRTVERAADGDILPSAALGLAGALILAVTLVETGGLVCHPLTLGIGFSLALGIAVAAHTVQGSGNVA